MGVQKIPPEGGSGGGRGHSNMEHWVSTREVKDAARIRRRVADRLAASVEMGSAGPFYKRLCNEELIGHGPSVWYFEVDREGAPIRQIELYEDGFVLWYDVTKICDEHGALGDQVLDREEFARYRIAEDEFSTVWAQARAARP